jgi:hypothetical protein
VTTSWTTGYLGPAFQAGFETGPRAPSSTIDVAASFSTTIEAASSHVAMVYHPDELADLIETAVKGSRPESLVRQRAGQGDQTKPT